MRVRNRCAGLPPVVVEYLDIVHALLTHEREIPIMIGIHHLGDLPEFELRDGFPLVPRDDDLMVPDSAHREIRALREIFRRATPGERRVFVRNDRETPIPVLFRIEKHRLLLSTRPKIKKRIGNVGIVPGTPGRDEILGTLRASGCDHDPVPRHDILPQLRFRGNGGFLCLFYLYFHTFLFVLRISIIPRQRAFSVSLPEACTLWSKAEPWSSRGRSTPA